MDYNNLSGKELNDAVKLYMPYVEMVARTYTKTLSSSVLVDDMIQAASIGLLRAFELYDESGGTPFEAYARIKMRGAMKDELRRNDWAVRSVRNNERTIEKTKHIIQNKFLREVTNKELAEELDISIGELSNRMLDADIPNMSSFEGLLEELNYFPEYFDPTTDSCFDAMRSIEKEELLWYLISMLPERQKYIMSSIIQKGTPLSVIGSHFGVSEATICVEKHRAVETITKQISTEYRTI